MKKRKQNAAPYQAAVQAFLTAKLHGTWDAIQYADQGGATNEYGVARNEGVLLTSASLMDNYMIVESACLIGEVVMAKCTSGTSTLQLNSTGYETFFYDYVIKTFSPYFPFFHACAQVLEKHTRMTGAEMKQIFEKMGLSL